MLDSQSTSAKRRLCILLLTAGLLVTGCQTPAALTEDQSTGSAPAASPASTEPVVQESPLPVNFQPGASNREDSIYPGEGNGGIDVQHYDLDITWDPESDEIQAKATLEILATENLSTFNLDFLGMDVTEVTLSGAPAYNSRDGSELTVSPDTGITAGQLFTVTVSYEGKPARIEGVGGGWTPYEGGVFVMGEPIAAKGWFPNNNIPSDKATYTFRVTVPEPYNAAANGLAQDPTSVDGKRIFEFIATAPMASYLASVNIDQFTTQEQKGPDGLEIVNYFAKGVTADQRAPFERFPEMVEVLSEKFGPYPFEAAGNIMVGVPVGLTQEAQTRAVFGLGTAEQLVVRELANQWFGNHVGLADWSDIWLKESFARYGEALWAEHAGGRNARDQWIKVTFEGLMGIQRIPKNALQNFLDLTQSPEATLTREQVQALIELGATEPVDETVLAEVLASIPDEGISNRQLAPALEKAPIEVFVLNTLDYARFNALLAGQNEPESLPDTFGLTEKLAPPPTRVQEAEGLYVPGAHDRGALALHALRLKVGDGVFFKILRTYLERFGGGTASTEDFLTVAEEVSGQDLAAFFQSWLDEPVIPDIPELNLLKANYVEQ